MRASARSHRSLDPLRRIEESQGHARFRDVALATRGRIGRAASITRLQTRDCRRVSHLVILPAYTRRLAAMCRGVERSAELRQGTRAARRDANSSSVATRSRHKLVRTIKRWSCIDCSRATVDSSRCTLGETECMVSRGWFGPRIGNYQGRTSRSRSCCRLCVCRGSSRSYKFVHAAEVP